MISGNPYWDSCQNSLENPCRTSFRSPRQRTFRAASGGGLSEFRLNTATDFADSRRQNEAQLARSSFLVGLHGRHETSSRCVRPRRKRADTGDEGHQTVLRPSKVTSHLATASFAAAAIIPHPTASPCKYLR